jgi:hypothetical protein
MSARALAKLERDATRRFRGRPTVVSALFDGRAAAYARVRFGIPIVRAGLLAFLHFVEWGILSQLLEPEFLGPILALRVAFSIVAGLGSSLLEPLRIELRRLRDAGEFDELAGRCDVAWTRAWWTGALFSAASFVFVAFAPQMGRGTISVVDAFLIAAVVRCASSWALRAYEAGLQAFGRIPRSPALFIVVDVFENLGPLLFWRLLGPWSIPAISVVSSALSFALGRHYARRAFSAKGIRVPVRLSLADPKLRERFHLATLLRAAGVGLALELPNVFLASTLAASSVSGLALGVYTARPLLAVLLHSARLYYADFARLSFLGAWGEGRLIAHIRRVVFVATLVCLAVGVPLALALDASPLVLVAIAVVLSASALFTAEVIASFFRERLRSMTAVAALGVVGTATVLFVDRRLLVTSALLPCVAIATWWLGRARASWVAPRSRQTLSLPALDFLAWAAARPELELWRLETRSRERAPAMRVQRVFADAGIVSSVWRRSVLFVACPAGASPHELLVRSGGLASSIARVDVDACATEMTTLELSPVLSTGAEPPTTPPVSGTLGDLFAATEHARRGPFGGGPRFGDYDVVVDFSRGQVAALRLSDARTDPATRKRERDAAWVENVRSVLSSSERARPSS